jgi:hypothetical protein
LNAVINRNKRLVFVNQL